MTHADLEIFDFRQNSALDDTAVSIRDWVRKSSSYFSDFWSQTSDFDAQLSTGSTVTQPYRDLLEKTVRENFYCIADIKDQTRSVWYASNRDLRIICNEMLGISDGDEATDDDLTAVEKSLAQLFIDNLAVALGAGWMGADKIEIAPTELVKDPHKAAIIRGTDLAILTPIEVKLRSGAATIQWILPKQKACNLLDTIVDKRKSAVNLHEAVDRSGRQVASGDRRIAFGASSSSDDEPVGSVALGKLLNWIIASINR